MTATQRAKARFARHFHAKAMYRMVWGTAECKRSFFVSQALLGVPLRTRASYQVIETVTDCAWRVA